MILKKHFPTIIAIVAIATLETIAILRGINGAYLGFAFTAIAGLGGYALGKMTKE